MPLQVSDICVGGRVRERAVIVQKKTGRPVQFELTEQTRQSVQEWLNMRRIANAQYVFPSRLTNRQFISTGQYARLVRKWVASAGLDSSAYGAHSMRRTKAAQIYEKTGNFHAVRIEVDDALSISDQVEL